MDRAAWAEAQAAEDRGLWTRPVASWPSGQLPHYRLGEVEEAEMRRALPSDDFIRAMCHDSRELVIGCAIHVCSPSCFKYHSKGASHICRHNFYHVINLCDDQENSVRRRRAGKPLRGCIAIVRDTRWGMAGRVVTYQLHPWECPTSYASLVMMRCNVDFQDLRRVLPPAIWLPESDLEPEPSDADLDTHRPVNDL